MSYTLEHFAYYNPENGQIYKVTHKSPNDFDCAMIIDNDLADGFLTNKLNVTDYEIVYLKGKLEVVRKNKMKFNFSFRHNVHYYIEDDKENADCIVLWNKKEKFWKFNFSDKAKNILKEKLRISKMVFFVTLHTDFDFLIRIMEVDNQEVLNDISYTVPFISSFENDISMISISTYAIFESYGLKIKDEQN